MTDTPRDGGVVNPLLHAKSLGVLHSSRVVQNALSQKNSGSGHGLDRSSTQGSRAAQSRNAGPSSTGKLAVGSPATQSPRIKFLTSFAAPGTSSRPKSQIGRSVEPQTPRGSQPGSSRPVAASSAMPLPAIGGPGRYLRGNHSGDGSSLSHSSSKSGNNRSGLSRVSPTPLAEEKGSATERGLALQWQGEAPKRFCVLRGSKVVHEKELSGLYILYCECAAMSKGSVTPDVLKNYSQRRKGALGPNANAKDLASGDAVLVNLAVSLSLALRFSYKPSQGCLTFEDFLRVTLPRASAAEVAFLTDSAPELASTSSLAKNVPIKALTQKEVVCALEIYELILTGTEQSVVTGNRLLMKLESIFPELCDASSGLIRQLSQVLPEGLGYEMPRDLYMTFLGINKASNAPIDLETLRAALLGADVVLGRYLRRGEVTSDKEVLEELKSAKPTGGGFLSKIISKTRKSLRRLF